MKRKTIRADCYLVLEKGKRWDVPLLVKDVRTKRPKLASHQIACKLTVTLPADVFEEFCPSVSIAIPAEMVAAPEVAVEVTNPDDPTADGGAR